MERLALGHKRPRKSPGAYDRRKHRLREIDAIARSRYGNILPNDVDGERYLKAVAYSANALGVSIEQAIDGWCARFAPHLRARLTDIAPPIRLEVEGRRYDLNADDAAELLGVTFEERQRLGLKTIGACDLTPEAFAAARKEAKRKRDREQRAAKRTAKKKRMCRAEYEASSISRAKPWEAEGISRASWYRRQRLDGTVVSPCAQGTVETSVSLCAQGTVETSVSLIRNLSDRATHLSQGPIEPSLDDLQLDDSRSEGGAPRAAETEDSDDAI
ncbi:MAG: hypothetical protein M9905_12165 [Rhizobiaceae bacterium]|nr:hypothetical protein [Rhizobiaceae bacterium]